MRRLLLSVSVVAALSAAGIASALTLNASTVGWSPAVTLWGSGDERKAVRGLHQLADASGALLHRLQLDAPTRAFNEAALDQLEDFDLADFHRLLPAAPGGFHELRVRGGLRDNRYVIERGDASRPLSVVIGGARHALFDMEQMLRIKPIVASGDGGKSYLIRAQLGFGAGSLRIQDLVAASTQIARIVGQSDPRADTHAQLPPSKSAVARVKALHPALQAEDVSSVAVVFDAYPRLFEVMARAGELEDLRTADAVGPRHVRLKMRADPERLAKHHPALARYFDKLDNLAQLDLRWLDASRRTLLKLLIDTDKLTVVSECYLQNGMIVPTRGTQLFADAAVDPTSDALAKSSMLVDVKLQLLGIVLKMRGVRLDVRYAYDEQLARMNLSITRPPASINVEGAALGFVPTSLIDAFIPGDIHGLAQDFFRIATTRNDGKGIQMALALGSAQPGTDAVLEAGGEMEVLDNRLVALGVAMVNERIIPNDAVVSDGKKLLSDMHAAFVQDLQRFEAQLGR